MDAGSTRKVWWLLLLAQLREQPGRMVVTVLAIAMGVALASGVAFVNSTALGEFTQATRRLVGEADVVVRGQPEGFDEALFVRLARDERVSLASPVLELDAALPGRRETLKILGLDPFRAGALQVELIANIGPQVLDLLRGDGIFLSGAAADGLKLKTGDRLTVIVGQTPKTLTVLGTLAGDAYSQPLGIMDIAGAQRLFNRLGILNRIDLRLPPGADVEAFRRELAAKLPPGVLALAPQIERERAVTVTRAYRVNLNMLALVALWTGAFLVFSTQSLSVLRRRRSLALLRALGVTRRQLELALMGEGAALGALGALLGVVAGALLAALMLRLLTADLGNSQLRVIGASLRAQPWSVFGFFVVGTVVAAVGSWLPARGAAREAPARALKGGDADYTVTARSASWSGVGLIALGAVLASLGPLGGLPVFGYAAIGALLFGAILLVPALTVRALRAAPATGRPVFDTAVAQLRENVGLSTLSLASIIVSFSLMVAMAIMVYSFRVSFEHWLGKLLPADIELRVPYGNDTAFWSPADQAHLAAIPGVGRIRFRRTQPLLLDPARPPITLIARDRVGGEMQDQLPLVQAWAGKRPAGTVSGWISEALQDLYGYRPGDTIPLPLGGVVRPVLVMGVWRDYARTSGTIVLERDAYLAAGGDPGVTDASIWLAPEASADGVQRAIQALFPADDAIEIMTSTAVRDRSLQIFDRAFAITYALEAIAVLIGLTGISFAASSTALARRAEFGVLRHIGMLRRQILGLLANEGLLLSCFGVAYGLLLGVVLSLVLVYVVNRQSFNWSIDLAVPLWQLGVIGVILIAAASVTATWSGRAAMSTDAVRAVREDW